MVRRHDVVQEGDRLNRIARLLVALVAGVLLVIPATQPAVAVPAVTTGSPESCAGVIAAAGGKVPGWAAAAIAAPFCGVWLGEQLVKGICWQSHQWWGQPARNFIWFATNGRYNKC